MSDAKTSGRASEQVREREREQNDEEKQNRKENSSSHQGVVPAGAQRHHVMRLGGVLLAREAAEVDLLSLF